MSKKLKILQKERGKGKSTGLIYTSEITGYRILCYTQKHCNYLKDMAKELGIIIPEPMTIREYKNLKGMPTDCGIMIDDLDQCLDEILNNYFGIDVMAVTITK